MIVNSTFENGMINIQSYSPSIFIIMTITACLFTYYSTSAIRGNSYNSVTIQSSRFINNFMTSGNLVYIQGSYLESLMIIDCLFYRISGGGTLYSSGNNYESLLTAILQIMK
jgi:hypothetical protein